MKMTPRARPRKPRARKDKTWPPGIVVGAIWLTVLSLLGVNIAQWWTVLVAIFIVIVINGILGFEQHRVPKVKEKTEWQKKDTP